MPDNQRPDDSRVNTDDAAGAERRSFQTKPGDVEPAAPDWEHTPTTPQANHAIEQGLGVGERELDAQDDPAKGSDNDDYSDEPDPEDARS